MTEVALDTCPLIGLNVSPSPAWSIAEHCVVDGQLTPTSTFAELESIDVGAGIPGACGLNVISRPDVSTAVHWVVAGHAIDSGIAVASIGVGAAPAGDCGLNVTSSLLVSIVVHCVVVGHEIASNAALLTDVATAPVGEAGLNVTTWPSTSVAVH